MRLSLINPKQRMRLLGCFNLKQRMRLSLIKPQATHALVWRQPQPCLPMRPTLCDTVRIFKRAAGRHWQAPKAGDKQGRREAGGRRHSRHATRKARRFEALVWKEEEEKKEDTSTRREPGRRAVRAVRAWRANG